MGCAQRAGPSLPDPRCNGQKSSSRSPARASKDAQTVKKTSDILFGKSPRREDDAEMSEMSGVVCGMNEKRRRQVGPRAGRHIVHMHAFTLYMQLSSATTYEQHITDMHGRNILHRTWDASNLSTCVSRCPHTTCGVPCVTLTVSCL